MAVEYNTTCPLSTSELTNTLAIKKHKVCKNHAFCRKGHKTRYYVCLGTLAQLVQTQIQNKYAQNDCLHSIGTKFVKDLYEWVYKSQNERFFVEDFFRSVITSIAFFAVGIKLTSELVAWRLP